MFEALQAVPVPWDPNQFFVYSIFLDPYLGPLIVTYILQLVATRSSAASTLWLRTIVFEDHCFVQFSIFSLVSWGNYFVYILLELNYVYTIVLKSDQQRQATNYLYKKLMITALWLLCLSESAQGPEILFVICVHCYFSQNAW